MLCQVFYCYRIIKGIHMLHIRLSSKKIDNKLFCILRLHDVLHSDKKLTLVFEYCDQVRSQLIDQM